MSRLESLLAGHCPDGVPFAALSEVGDWYGGSTPAKSNRHFWTDGDVPWLTPKDMTSGLVSATEDHITRLAVERTSIRLVPAGSVAFVMRSNVLRKRMPVAKVAFGVTLNQDMRAVVPRDGIALDYLCLVCRARSEEIRAAAGRTDGSMAAISGSKLMDFKVPLPPLVVQEEIALILLRMETLQAELEADLEAERIARVQQFEHYRDQLLNSLSLSLSLSRPMGEVGVFIRGRRFTKSDLVTNGLACINFGEIYTHYATSTRDVISHVRSDLAPSLRFARTGDVIITGVSETVGDICKAVAWLGEDDVAVHDDCFAYRSELNPKFVSYYLQTARFHEEKAKYVARSKVKRISAESLAKISIPVPPQAEQDRIVGILDSFDALASDLSEGLPAEIAARRQQYEYYRDLLLTFPEKVDA